MAFLHRVVCRDAVDVAMSESLSGKGKDTSGENDSHCEINRANSDYSDADDTKTASTKCEQGEAPGFIF